MFIYFMKLTHEGLALDRQLPEDDLFCSALAHALDQYVPGESGVAREDLVQGLNHEAGVVYADVNLGMDTNEVRIPAHRLEDVRQIVIGAKESPHLKSLCFPEDFDPVFPLGKVAVVLEACTATLIPTATEG